jgi:hypothetical protein
MTEDIVCLELSGDQGFCLCVRLAVSGVGSIGALCLEDCLPGDLVCREGCECRRVGKSNIHTYMLFRMIGGANVYNK